MTMRKVQNFADDRNKGWCVHCGGPNETRDHGPSVVFLDDPLPPDLPACPSCEQCNQSFSEDEAYLAALLECVIAGGADPSGIQRPKIAGLMRNRRRLVEELAAARSDQGGQVIFNPDEARVRNVISKLARCHIAFELNQPRTDEPKRLWWRPLMQLTADEREEFENPDTGDLAGWPEVGSRAMSRLLVFGDEVFEDDPWLEVQPGRYRYRADEADGLRVRMVIRDYLACEVVWD
jgi:hypothetical protein